MLKCIKCERQTQSGEPTGKFTTYRNKTYIDGIDGREAMSELNVCSNCIGEAETKKDKKENETN